MMRLRVILALTPVRAADPPGDLEGGRPLAACLTIGGGDGEDRRTHADKPAQGGPDEAEPGIGRRA